ncbi:nuclear transport factor 2 family protein [Streptomyces flavidovirens]
MWLDTVRVTPGPAHRLLDPLVGTWQATKTNWLLGEGGKPVVSQDMTVKVRWLKKTGGRFLSEAVWRSTPTSASGNGWPGSSPRRSPSTTPAWPEENRPNSPLPRSSAAWTSALGGYDATQHLITNHLVDIEGDTAVCTAAFQATHRLATAHGSALWTLGGTYRFGLVRTAGHGWRISSVVMTTVWADGNQHLPALAAARTS